MTGTSIYLLQQNLNGEWVDWDIVEWTYPELVLRTSLARRQGRTVRALNENMVEVA